MNVVCGRRKPSLLDSNLEHPTIAIAYKPTEWVLIDCEQVDLGEVKRWFGPNANEYTEGNNLNAMLCLFKHQTSRKKIIVGNAHFEHDPRRDHVKYAQAAFFIERAAKYIRENSGNDGYSLPFISGGDYNALPISSTLSAFYDEDIEGSNEMAPSLWQLPKDLP